MATAKRWLLPGEAPGPVRIEARRRRFPRAAVGLALAVLLPLAASPAAAQPSGSAFTTGYRFDSDGRATGTIAPDPDGAGPLGFQAVRNSYDSGGRLVKVEKGQLAVWQSEAVQPKDWTGFTIFQTLDRAYDAMDRKVREWSSGGGVTASVAEYGYDVDGRLKCTAVRMNPDAWSTPLPDKCVPGPAHVTYGADRISKTVYDAASQVTESWDGVGTPLQRREAQYTYNPNGQKQSLTDARGFRAEMTYDGHGRLSRWIFPSKTAAGVADQNDYEEYGYDAGGNRTSLRKRDGSTLTYQYDALNRMTMKVVPERSGLAAAHSRDVHYDYDLRGLVTKARFDSLAGEGVTNDYDGFGRLLSSSSNMGGVARAVGNLYDANGNRVRVTHPDGAFFTYEIDGLDRPTWIRENGGDPITYFTYDHAGRRASSAWNMTAYAYDPAGRLQTLSHNPAGTDRDQSLGFAYNPAGQIVTRSASNDVYAWTGAVNTNRPYAVNGQNQYTSAGTATFGYDPNGNLASTANAPSSTAYVYDVENRLVSASGAHNAELVYDPLGRLFQVSSGASIRRLVYDGDALIAEYDVNGTMPHRYIHGNDAGADDPLVWYHNAAYGWRQILFHDHQGSIVGVTDMYGNSIAANAYDEWGIPGANNAGRFGYTGQAWVPELGLWYYKARFYSPTLGRFLQTDPIGYEDQVNLYAYVANDPVNKADPDGKRIEIVGDEKYKKAVYEQLKTIERTRAGNSGIKELSRSSHVIRISQREGPENHTDPVGRVVNGLTVDAYNGRGTGSRIGYNPYDNKNGGFDDKGKTSRPAVAGLAHEIGHALANLRGRASLNMQPMNPASTPPAEREAIKFENDFRKEVGITPRSYYYPKDPE